MEAVAVAVVVIEAEYAVPWSKSPAAIKAGVKSGEVTDLKSFCSSAACTAFVLKNLEEVGKKSKIFWPPAATQSLSRLLCADNNRWFTIVRIAQSRHVSG